MIFMSSHDSNPAAASAALGAAAPAKKPRLVKTEVQLVTSKVSIYAGKNVADALREVSDDMTIYKSVRLAQVLEAAYAQGRKDGAREVKQAFETCMATIPHANPGRPKKRKK